MVPSPPGRNSRHCPRVRARAMAAFDYLIDSEYSGGPSGRSGEGEGALSLFNFLQISADGERGNGGLVAIVFVASTCPACVRHVHV